MKLRFWNTFSGCFSSSDIVFEHFKSIQNWRCKNKLSNWQRRMLGIKEKMSALTRSLLSKFSSKFSQLHINPSTRLIGISSLMLLHFIFLIITTNNFSWNMLRATFITASNPTGSRSLKLPGYSNVTFISI